MLSDRAVAPVVGVLLVVTMTVLCAALAFAVDVGPAAPPSSAAFGIDAGAPGEVTVIHEGGSPIDPATLQVRVYVDDEPLKHQPPIPFFSATGFESAPTGAFNSARTGEWRAGESASLQIATTNEPFPAAGSSIRLRIFEGSRPIADLTTTVG